MGTEIRTMWFGKYKGHKVLRVIAEHIGYIMWCLENLKWFHLNEDEQKFYDWQAIAIKKYCVCMTFPVETMYKHVKDQNALKELDTPYRFLSGNTPYLPANTDISHLLKEAGVIAEVQHEPHPVSDKPWWCGLQKIAIKELDIMEDEEIDEMVTYGVTLPFHP